MLVVAHFDFFVCVLLFFVFLYVCVCMCADTIYNPEISDNSYDTETRTYNSSIFKVLLPVAMLFGICSCLCGVARKRAKRTAQPQCKYLNAIHQHTFCAAGLFFSSFLFCFCFCLYVVYTKKLNLKQS